MRTVFASRGRALPPWERRQSTYPPPPAATGPVRTNGPPAPGTLSVIPTLRMKSTLLRTAFLLLAAVPTSAQLISGTVVDANGNPVPGVNINAYDSTGDEVHLANDGTNALGQFLALFED